MGKPKLSICYPTYNRADIIYGNVMRCLKYEGDDIEVIVQDNCSTDHTEKILSEIKDPRFHYYRNSENIGPVNLMTILTKSQANFALLLSDEDEVIVERIPNVLALLNGAASMCGVIKTTVSVFGKVNTKYDDEKKESGFSSINRILFHTYMSGYIYNVDRIRRLSRDDTNYFRVFSKGGSYVFLYLAILILRNTSLYTSSLVFVNHRDEGEHDISTYYFNGKHVYSPDGRIEVFRKHFDCLNRCVFSMEQKKFFVRRMIYAVWDYSCPEWVSTCIDSIKTKPDYGILFIDDDFNIEKVMTKIENDLVDYADSIGFCPKQSFYDELMGADDLLDEYKKNKNQIVRETNKLLEEYYKIKFEIVDSKVLKV